jgi:PKD repeat protein
VALTGSPAGGTWSGAHVTGSTFSAVGLAAGPYTVTYTFTNANGCTNSADAIVTVNALPVVTADAKSVCIGGSVALTGSPAGGTWSGAHVTGSTFSAVGLAAGPYTVTYTFTNANGCTNSADAIVTVNALPVVTADAKSVCIGGSVALTGSPAGGTWSGAHVTGSTFSAVGLAAGPYTVTYTFTNANGCTNSADAIVTVESCATEGCTLGYWKNHTDRWCEGYRTCDRFGDVFTSAPANLANLTLLEALNLGGGGIFNLARQGVAALLNTCSADVDYPSPYGSNSQMVIDAVNAAYAAGGKTAAGNLASQLDMLNNSGCPLGGTRANDGSNCILDTRVGSTAGSVPEKAKGTEKAGFTASPVPFRDQLTIRYDFDYISKVKIEVFNAQGTLVYSKLDADSYLNKEITLNLNVNKGQKQVFIVKLTTDRGSSTKKVLSAD